MIITHLLYLQICMLLFYQIWWILICIFYRENVFLQMCTPFYTRTSTISCFFVILYYFFFVRNITRRKLHYIVSCFQLLVWKMCSHIWRSFPRVRYCQLGIRATSFCETCRSLFSSLHACSSCLLPLSLANPIFFTSPPSLSPSSLQTSYPVF